MRKNTVEMILDQARTGREVIGTRVTVAPENKDYLVTDVDRENETVTVTEELPKESLAAADVVVLSAKNANIGHYVCNPNEKPALEARIDNNELVIGDEADGNSFTVNYGQIPVKEVVANFNGGILLAAEGKDSIDLWMYNIQEDEFSLWQKAFAPKDSRFAFTRLDSDVAILTATKIVTEELTDDDGTVKGTRDVLLYSKAYSISKNGCPMDIFCLEDEDIDYDADLSAEDIEYLDEKPITFPKVDAIHLIKQADRRNLVMKITTEVDCENTISELTVYKYLLYKVDIYGNVTRKVAEFFADDPNVSFYLGGPSSTAPVITVKEANRVRIKTNRGILTINDSNIVKALNEGDYNYFDGVYSFVDEEGRPGAKWCYSNSIREEICFTSVNTDRGYIFSLVD